MGFDLSTESGAYGRATDQGEYFRVIADSDDVSIVFHSAVDSTYEFYARRPADLTNDDFLDSLKDDARVFPDSDVDVVPEFPIGKGPYEDTCFSFYAARRPEERHSDAIVEVSLGEEDVRDEKVRWVNRHKETDGEAEYQSEVWYIGEEIDEQPILHYLSHGSLDESELSDLLPEVRDILSEHDFDDSEFHR